MPQTRKDGPYRITGLHPWPSAGPADVLVEILSHGFVGQEVDADELELFVASVGGQMEGPVESTSAGHSEVVVCLHGHYISLTLESLSS
jgi:hypothetical protein